MKTPTKDNTFKSDIIIIVLRSITINGNVASQIGDIAAPPLLNSPEWSEFNEVIARNCFLEQNCSFIFT